MAGRGGRAAIVSTMRSPGQAHLAAWLAYHRAIGFRRFFLYFDDPDDPDRAAATGRDVVAIRCDAALEQRLRASRRWPMLAEFATGTGVDRLMARQQLHVEDALARIAADRMPLDWLLHIDHDELFSTPGDDAAAHFAALVALGTDHAIYLNHEAVPETLEVDDVFRDVTLFKRNPYVLRRLRGNRAAVAGARRFIAYSHGKAAIRIGVPAQPDGVHRFIGVGARLMTRWIESPCILHYPSCGFARWRLKYRMLGDFPDLWFGQHAISLGFHTRSRDARDAPDAMVRGFFRRHAMLGGPVAREALRRRGLIVRIRGPSRVLARLDRASRSRSRR